MSNGKNLWIPMIVGTSIIILNLLFWQELVRQEDVYIKKNAELAAASISHDIRAEIQTRTLGLLRMARRWELEGGTTKPKWEADALNYYRDYPGFQALEWADESNYVRWIIPVKGNEAAQNLNLTFEERRSSALAKARQTRQVSITRAINLAQGGKGFLMVIPLFPKNKFDGFIISSFRSQILFNAILSKNLLQKYAIAIFDGNEKIYTNQEELIAKIPTKWQHNTEINLNGITWRLQVLPTVTTATEHSPLPTVVLSGGTLVAVLFAWGVYLTQQSRRQTQQLKAINHELADQIAESQRTETELRNLSTALESAVEGISHFNLEQRYVYVNQAYAKIIGYQPQEILGMEWQQTIHTEDQEKVMVKYQRMLEDGKAEVEARGVRQDGSVFDMQVVIVKACDRYENYKGYYCFVKDISHRREIERIKDEFVSVVSHELRTPLTSIRGSLGLIASGVLNTQPEKAQRMLDIAVNNTDRLIRLINDILDIERIESGKVSMTKQICDVPSLMQQSVEEMQSMADKAGVALSVSPILAKLWADPDRIVQIFTNLLSNAIKFSPQGSTIWFNAEVETRHGASNVNTETRHGSSLQILFTIRDRGRGIPADKIETIFGRFQQVDASDSRKKGGTGLGLAICRSIIQCHDGRIWAESSVGEGSTFYISLPLYQEPIIPSVPRNNSDIPLILVCDDDPSVRVVMQTMLEQRGYQTICAASGQEAIEVAIKQQPDAIFLNLMMPGMHGWETLGVLKQQPQTKDIPAIVLSGLMPDARNTSHSHVTDWIVKPPDEKLLFQALERALAGEKSQSLKVLIVEDDTDLAQVLIAVFERHGVETYHAKTGREALRLSQRILPDLLVLDLALPEVDGFAVVDWLRHHRRLCMVPLVVYCAKDLNNFDRERLKLGQTLFFTKGRVTPEEFEEHIVSLLNRIIPTIKGDTSDSQTHSYH